MTDGFGLIIEQLRERAQDGSLATEYARNLVASGYEEEFYIPPALYPTMQAVFITDANMLAFCEQVDLEMERLSPGLKAKRELIHQENEANKRLFTEFIHEHPSAEGSKTRFQYH